MVISFGTSLGPKLSWNLTNSKVTLLGELMPQGPADPATRKICPKTLMAESRVSWISLGI